jgi:uncharacterized membrane protein
MARQKQGRGASGQPASSKSSGAGSQAPGPGGEASPSAARAGNGSANRSGSGNPAGRPGQPTAGSANRGGRPGQSGGSSGRSGRPGQTGGGKANRNDRPGPTAAGNASRGGRPGQPGGNQARRQAQQRGQRGAALAREGALADAAIPRPPAPSWLRWTTLILSLVGLGFSTYLTIAHYTGSAILACPANSFINCGEVTNSPESIIFGVFPVAVLGLAFYVFMVAINSPWAWRSERPAIRWARLGGIVTGMAFVLYLVYAELIEIGKLCEYCTAVHIITFALFVMIVFDASFRTASASSAARR